MGLLRGLVILLAVGAAAAQVLQELRQISIVKQMPPREALRHYEQRRKRSDRGMLIVTIMLMVGAAAAMTWHLNQGDH